MPNWKVHLEVAKRLNNKLKYTDEELEKFNLGNLLPDINSCYIVTDISKKIDHKFTHFQDKKEEPSYINFKKIYGEKIYNNSLLLGYYTHLYTDYTWNNYFYTQYDNHPKLQGMTHEEKRKIKQDDFKAYNDLFIENRPKFNNLKDLVHATNEISRVSINESDVKKVEEFLEKQEKFNYEYKILSTEVLNEMMNTTINNLTNEILQNK